MKLNILLIVLSLALGSCINSALPTKKPKPEAKIEEYSEDLSVFLPIYEEKISKETPTTDNTKNTTAIKPTESIVNQNVEVDAILEKYKELNKRMADGNGYRIQVFIGNRKADFESAKSFLFRNYAEHEVYESYSQPTYKLKMGDFMSYIEAETTLSDIKSRYSSARIVSEKINIKNAINNK